MAIEYFCGGVADSEQFRESFGFRCEMNGSSNHHGDTFLAAGHPGFPMGWGLEEGLVTRGYGLG